MGIHYTVRVTVIETTDAVPFQKGNGSNGYKDTPEQPRQHRNLVDVGVQADDEVHALRKAISMLEVEELAINSNKPAKKTGLEPFLRAGNTSGA